MEERDRDLDRLLTFVDAIVAIAITLLVLPLVELAGEVDAGAGSGAVADLLGEHVSQLLAFFLSFVVIARLWLAQHRVVRGLLSAGSGVAWTLLSWTLTIVVLPFPTALAAQTERDPLVIALYIGTMAVSSAFIAVLGALVARETLAAGVDPPDPRVAMVTVACFGLALALALLVPGVGYWGLLALLLAEPVEHRLRSGAATRSSA